MIDMTDNMNIRLNALAGIDGFWTKGKARRREGYMGLNALAGIDGFWTMREGFAIAQKDGCLNALAGIDGFWTCCTVVTP